MGFRSTAPKPRPGERRRPQRVPTSWGRFVLKPEHRAMTVLIYVNTNKQVGDVDHIKVFANADAAERWFEENDPEGVAFEYEVLE